MIHQQGVCCSEAHLNRAYLLALEWMISSEEHTLKHWSSWTDNVLFWDSAFGPQCWWWSTSYSSCDVLRSSVLLIECLQLAVHLVESVSASWPWDNPTVREVPTISALFCMDTTYFALETLGNWGVVFERAAVPDCFKHLPHTLKDFCQGCRAL